MIYNNPKSLYLKEMTSLISNGLGIFNKNKMFQLDKIALHLGGS